MKTGNKLLKDEVKNKQKLIERNIIQAQSAFAQGDSVTRKTSDKSISHTTGNNAFCNDEKKESNAVKDDRLKELQVSLKIFILRFVKRQ